MTTDPLDSVLEKLCTGDDSAAEQVFRTYEPYLRMIVRRMLPNHLRSKFDSVDVVQSVWADVLTGFREGGWRFNSAAQLKAFLIKATRNRFIDRVRQHRNATEHQMPLDEQRLADISDDNDVSPSALMQADELWERILHLCPPAHHDILRLKRQGCSLAEIAASTGLHESSIRRILYDLARKVASLGTEENN